MEKIIKIDNKARIEIISRNLVLQYYKKVKNKKTGKTEFQWITDGYFPNMVSLATEYILNAPQATGEAVCDLEGVIKAIKKAEANIIKVLTKKDETNPTQKI